MTLTATPYLEYSDAEHRYFADGRERKSVTQLLDAAGLISQFCRDEEARFRGSKVHEFCAVDDITPLDLRTVPTALRGYVRAWRQYRKDSGFMPTLIEHRVDCADYGYAGRFDRLGVMPGKQLLTLLDIKTSKAGTVADYVRLQLAAYAFAYQPHGVFERIAVSLMPDGRYKAYPYSLSQFHTDRAEWLSLVMQQKEKK